MTLYCIKINLQLNRNLDKCTLYAIQNFHLFLHSLFKIAYDSRKTWKTTHCRQFLLDVITN